jgi:serine/threonine protein kinase
MVASARYVLHFFVTQASVFKPHSQDSIYVDSEGIARVGDFGLAKLIVQSTHSLGTFMRWCAPELIQLSMSDSLELYFARSINESTDIYSFGLYPYSNCFNHEADILVGMMMFGE